MDDKIYARALQRLRTEFFPAFLGKTFTSDEVYRYFLVDKMSNAVEVKKALGLALYNLSQVNKKRQLEQTGRTYRIIDRELNVIEWWKAMRGDTLDIRYPRGVEDESSFGFEDSILVYPKDAIVIAGEGNTAKTAWCLNFMIENMDKYPCYYFTSEFNDAKFRDRMGHFRFAELFKPDGMPKFTLVEQTENWQDKIQPNAINIVDWVYLDDEMWKVRTIIKNIIASLTRGIAVVVLQKRSHKTHGEGGESTKDLASVYLTIRNDTSLGKVVLKAEKVKTPRTVTDNGHFIGNPNFREWSFEVIESGSQFHNITLLSK